MTNIKLRKLSAVAILVMIPFASILPSDQIPAKDQDHPIALTGGTIHTVSGEVISNGTILFESGRITKIGKNIDPQTPSRAAASCTRWSKRPLKRRIKIIEAAKTHTLQGENPTV